MRSWTPKRQAAVVLIAVSLVAMAGCAHGGGSAKSNSLDGTRWKLTEWAPSSPSRADSTITLSPVRLSPVRVTITADFAGGQISGTSGVNTYSGSYKVGPGDAFSVGPLASTLIAGPEPAMRAERAYMELLTEARSYKMAAGTLTLYDAAGNASLVFAAASQ